MSKINPSALTKKDFNHVFWFDIPWLEKFIQKPENIEKISMLDNHKGIPQYILKRLAKKNIKFVLSLNDFDEHIDEYLTQYSIDDICSLMGYLNSFEESTSLKIIKKIHEQSDLQIYIKAIKQYSLHFNKLTPDFEQVLMNNNIIYWGGESFQCSSIYYDYIFAYYYNDNKKHLYSIETILSLIKNSNFNEDYFYKIKSNNTLRKIKKVQIALLSKAPKNELDGDFYKNIVENNHVMSYISSLIKNPNINTNDKIIENLSLADFLIKNINYVSTNTEPFEQLWASEKVSYKNIDEILDFFINITNSNLFSGTYSHVITGIMKNKQCDDLIINKIINIQWNSLTVYNNVINELGRKLNDEQCLILIENIKKSGLYIQNGWILLHNKGHDFFIKVIDSYKDKKQLQSWIDGALFHFHKYSGNYVYDSYEVSAELCEIISDIASEHGLIELSYIKNCPLSVLWKMEKTFLNHKNQAHIYNIRHHPNYKSVGEGILSILHQKS